MRSLEDLHIRRVERIFTYHSENVPIQGKHHLQMLQRPKIRCRDVTRPHLKFENQPSPCCCHESSWIWWSPSGRTVRVDLGGVACALGRIEVRKQDGDPTHFAEMRKESVADVCALSQHDQESLLAWYANGGGGGGGGGLHEFKTVASASAAGS